MGNSENQMEAMACLPYQTALSVCPSVHPSSQQTLSRGIHHVPGPVLSAGNRAKSPISRVTPGGRGSQQAANTHAHASTSLRLSVTDRCKAAYVAVSGGLCKKVTFTLSLEGAGPKISVGTCVGPRKSGRKGLSAQQSRAKTRAEGRGLRPRGPLERGSAQLSIR